MASNIEIFLPIKSAMNIETRHPNDIPNLNIDINQEASLVVISKGRPSIIIGDVHPKNRPPLSWAKHTVLSERLLVL